MRPRPPPPDSALPQEAPLLAFYRAIERASEEMLQAAHAGDWDRVAGLEGACAVLISRLRHAAGATRLDAEEARTKRGILLRILGNDARIRHLAEPGCERMDRLLSPGPPRKPH